MLRDRSKHRSTGAQINVTSSSTPCLELTSNLFQPAPLLARLAKGGWNKPSPISHEISPCPSYTCRHCPALLRPLPCISSGGHCHDPERALSLHPFCELLPCACQRTTTAKTQASAPAQIHWDSVSNDLRREGANMDVPLGWQVQGGMYRFLATSTPDG